MGEIYCNARLVHESTSPSLFKLSHPIYSLPHCSPFVLESKNNKWYMYEFKPELIPIQFYCKSKNKLLVPKKLVIIQNQMFLITRNHKLYWKMTEDLNLSTKWEYMKRNVFDILEGETIGLAFMLSSFYSHKPCFFTDLIINFKE